MTMYFILKGLDFEVLSRAKLPMTSYASFSELLYIKSAQTSNPMG